MKRRHFLATTSAALAGTSLSGCKKNDSLVLRIYTWADYISPKLIQQFESENNCKIQIDTFDSNESLYAKLSAGASGYDLLTPSSYMAKTLMRENKILPLEAAKIPNLKHIDRDYLQRALDPEMKYSVPYLMACTCLAWLNSKVKDPIASYGMFDRNNLKGRITLLDDMREVLGAALRSIGFSLNSKNPAELALARDVVIRWKWNIAKFDSEQYKGGISSGEFFLVQGYAPDLLQVADENSDITVKIPEEGSAFSCDDFCIPSDSKQVELAYQFINFITEPANAAVNMLAIASRAPNSSAYSLLSEDFRGNETLFPNPEVFAKCEPIDDLGDALALWSKAWDEVKSAS